jgi:hypothetical protein
MIGPSEHSSFASGLREVSAAQSLAAPAARSHCPTACVSTRERLATSGSPGWARVSAGSDDRMRPPNAPRASWRASARRHASIGTAPALPVGVRVLHQESGAVPAAREGLSDTGRPRRGESPPPTWLLWSPNGGAVDDLPDPRNHISSPSSAPPCRLGREAAAATRAGARLSDVVPSSSDAGVEAGDCGTDPSEPGLQAVEWPIGG